VETTLDNPDEIGRLVRSRRHELNLTQGEVAAVARTGVRFISELESGKRSVQLDTLLKVLDALGLTLVAKSR
jgi:HTH-type transcriptional regulator / antitoxin HipB